MRPAHLTKFLHFGLIGFPLGHSLSPRLHQAALKHYHLEGEYQLYPVEPLPQGKSGLVSLLGRIRGGELDGLNVTIPHKQSVLDLVDELTPAANLIGAVNTIINRDGKLVGDNTDAPGFWAEIEALWGCKNPARALVLGSGGGARAVVYSLAAHDWEITIAAARPEDIPQANKLASDLSKVGGRLDVVELNESISGRFASVALVVNTTPLGMSPNKDASPWPEGCPFPPACKVFDIVYNPLETRLVASARAAGIPAETGLGMLICQAALAFERWTGLPAPFDVMRRSVN